MLFLAGPGPEDTAALEPFADAYLGAAPRWSVTPPAAIIVPGLRHHVVEPDEDRQNGLAIFGLNASYYFVLVYELSKVKIAKHAHWRSSLFRGEGKDSGLRTAKAYDAAEIMVDFRF